MGTNSCAEDPVSPVPAARSIAGGSWMAGRTAGRVPVCIEAAKPATRDGASLAADSAPALMEGDPPMFQCEGVHSGGAIGRPGAGGMVVGRGGSTCGDGAIGDRGSAIGTN